MGLGADQIFAAADIDFCVYPSVYQTANARCDQLMLGCESLFV